MDLNAQIFPKSEIIVPGTDTEPHLLVSAVRKAYLDYIKKILYENYKANDASISSENIESILRLAEKIELKAAAQSMLVSLYRKNITTMISTIKHHTELNQLHPYSHLDLPKNTFRSDKTTQTESIQMMNCDNSSIKNNNNCDKFEFDGYRCNVKIFDNVDLQMEEIFNDNSDDIFGDQMNKIQFNLIMSEIENYGKNNKNELQQNLMNGSQELPPVCDTSAVTIAEKNIVADKTESKLKPVCTRWLCEEHFQNAMLCQKLNELSEISIKLHKRVKDRYVDLFGFESEDEEIVQSPCANPTLLRSCRVRIQPWVKNHTKRFIDKYKVASHLFEPLVKRLVYKLLEVNRYPSDLEVYDFIKEYFKQRVDNKMKSKADF